MRNDILKRLLVAHADHDEPAFRKAAVQLASAESAAGHIRLAEDLRAVIARMGRNGTSPARREGLSVDATSPPTELSGLLEISQPRERLHDIVLPKAAATLLTRVLAEQQARPKLERWSVAPRRHLLFHGPPGCGKTLAAAVLAGELGLPLMTVRFDALFSRFLGATANHLRLIFNEMPRRPGVYFFDEFDVVAKRRGDAQDVGELQRIVTSFLQLIDADTSLSLVIAATNHADLLDHAVFRRFDVVVPFTLPSRTQLEALLALRLKAFGLQTAIIRRLAAKCNALSYADVTMACKDAIRTMVLEGREELAERDLTDALSAVGNEQTIRRGKRPARKRSKR